MEDQELLIDAEAIIPAEELNQRIGEGDAAFVSRLTEGNFTVLFTGKPPRTNGGKVYYLCTKGTPRNIHQIDWEYYSFDGVFIYKSEYENYKKDGRQYLDWPTCKDGEWIPATVARKLLNMTPREFKKILDDGDIETDVDDIRVAAYKRWIDNGYSGGVFNFFNDENIKQSNVNRISLQQYAERNNIELSIDVFSYIGTCKRLEVELANAQEEKHKFERWYHWMRKKYSTIKEEIDKLKSEQAAQEQNIIEDEPRTAKATIGRLKKRLQEVTDGYEGAANLACEISRRGPKANGTPWTEPELLALSDELGVTIKGDCLKAFKAGMPAELVKKDAGARPTTPREESPDDVES